MSKLVEVVARLEDFERKLSRLRKALEGEDYMSAFLASRDIPDWMWVPGLGAVLADLREAGGAR